jgi:nicotinate-nucleotide adenylyltransferase
MVKVGVMGGTFDPIHNGHLRIAEETRKRLDLEYVLFMPAGQPWLKSALPVSNAEDRYEMVRLAIAPYSHMRISRIEVDRTGPSYTVDTMEELKAELGEGRLYFIIGWDCVPQLPKWHNIARLIELCEIAAVFRPGYAAPDTESLESQIPGITKRIALLDSPRIDISATEIRERIARGRPIAELVPQTVEKYIKERRLYQADIPKL